MNFDSLSEKAAGVLEICRTAGVRLVTAESCTGGLIAAMLTEIAGSSDVFERGFVTYTNAAKTELLGVAPELIETRGAVSEQVARAMAEGALARARADIAISVTGIAGPGGGTADKPVGLVHFGLAMVQQETRHQEARFGPLIRRDIRFRTVTRAFEMIEAAVNR